MQTSLAEALKVVSQERQQAEGHLNNLRTAETQLQALLNGNGLRTFKLTATHKPRRTLSPSARRKIAEAQRRRWAEYHKAQGR